jgi:hypothetical protein
MGAADARPAKIKAAPVHGHLPDGRIGLLQ